MPVVKKLLLVGFQQKRKIINLLLLILKIITMRFLLIVGIFIFVLSIIFHVEANYCAGYWARTEAKYAEKFKDVCTWLDEDATCQFFSCKQHGFVDGHYITGMLPNNWNEEEQKIISDSWYSFNECCTDTFKIPFYCFGECKNEI